MCRIRHEDTNTEWLETRINRVARLLFFTKAFVLFSFILAAASLALFIYVIVNRTAALSGLDDSISVWCNTLNAVLTFIFGVEIGVRYLAIQQTFWQSKWNVLDIFLFLICLGDNIFGFVWVEREQVLPWHLLLFSIRYIVQIARLISIARHVFHLRRALVTRNTNKVNLEANQCNIKFLFRDIGIHLDNVETSPSGYIPPGIDPSTMKMSHSEGKFSMVELTDMKLSTLRPQPDLHDHDEPEHRDNSFKDDNLHEALPLTHEDRLDKLEHIADKDKNPLAINLPGMLPVLTPPGRTIPDEPIEITLPPDERALPRTMTHAPSILVGIKVYLEEHRIPISHEFCQVMSSPAQTLQRSPSPVTHLQGFSPDPPEGSREKSSPFNEEKSDVVDGEISDKGREHFDIDIRNT